MELAARTFTNRGADCQPSILRRVVSAAPGAEEPEEALELDLAELWGQLQSGACLIADCQLSASHCYFQVRFRASGLAAAGPAPRTRQILQRVLLGESQKSVALDFGIAPSTMTLVCARGLSMLGCEETAARSPIVLVMAAHAEHGYSMPHARVSRSMEAGHIWNVRLERPDLTLPAVLTPAEQAIVRRLIEGQAYSSIAESRATSARTVANQVASVFRKLRVSGRGELRAQVVKAHAFTQQPMPLAQSVRNR